MLSLRKFSCGVDHLFESRFYNLTLSLEFLLLVFLGHGLVFFSLYRIALILALAVVVYIAMAFVCHGPSLPSCFK